MMSKELRKPVSFEDDGRKIDSDFSVLFSGGLDSTAVAIHMGNKFTGKMHLMTLDHNYGHLFTGLSARHIQDLNRLFGPERVAHSIENITDVFRVLALKEFRKDLFEYGHFIWCLSCILSLYTKVLINNLIHQVPFAFICSSVGGEYAIMSMQATIDGMRSIGRAYGVDYRAPLLELNMGKPAERALLKKFDVWPGLKVLKGVQGVQPICLPGFMHILDNLFDIHTTYNTEKVEAFILSRKPIIERIVRETLQKRGVDPDDAIDRLSAFLDRIETDS